MKITLKQGLMAFLATAFFAAAIGAVAPAISASADAGNVTCKSATGNYLNEDYVSVYKVPTSMMTYETNGGADGGRPLSNAFDGNWGTSWVSGRDNVEPNNLIAITVSFSQPVTIQNILYATSGEGNDGAKGYPTTLGIYTANGGDLSLYGTCTSTATNGRVVFSLSETITVTRIKFEFKVVTSYHKWQATAKEIQFLQPDNADVNKVLDLFDDYAQLSVKEQYKSGLSQMRKNVSGLISYETALKPLLDRADAILSGHLYKDSRRELSTNPDAENVIKQYGNLRNYAGNTLKMSYFGINRQVTGVAGLAGQTITIYVDAPAGDPLPNVVCTQVHGDWRSWKSSFNLVRGKNVITFPNYITGNYSTAAIPGGPIHIENPYEPSQQSSNLKIYIEGGYLYPVFRKDVGDETTFRDELTSYRNKMSAEGLNDVVELVGDHFLHTATATRAYNDFVNRGVSPQKNAENWDDYIADLLEFDGVTMNPDGEHFNEKNLHLYTNFRKVQPWGGAGAFAHYDHIGFISFGEDGMTSFGSPGWGVTHEIGHALDCTAREISETTNNMWPKHELAAKSSSASRNQNDWITNNLTPDETALGFLMFNRNREVYQLWWNIESYFRGYWGRLDNTYRYYNENAARTAAGVTNADGNLTKNERMVYFSSIATGIDMGYYFERCSFSFDSDNSTVFRRETATEAYKKLVKHALETGLFEDNALKLWYLDAWQDDFDMNSTGCYNSSMNVQIVSANKTSAGYVLYLPQPKDKSKHLGYEIMEYRGGKWYVIGFTYTGSYTDATKYADGYVPQYKIRAYDRKLNCTAESSVESFDDIRQTYVCRINTTYYDSLSEAVKAATAGDTIYICANLFDVAMTIDKNLTILPDTSVKESVTIIKTAAGALFTVNNNVTLTLGSNDGAKIILDGNLFSQNGALINVNGGGARLNVYNVELCDNINTSHGGAVYNTGGATFTNVTFKNNSTSQNGGAIANFSGGVITLTDCTFTNNTAKEFGGALTLDGKTTLINVTITGNKATKRGGAIYMACGNNSRAVSIEGGTITDNTADFGSAIYLENGELTLFGGEKSTAISGMLFKNQGTLYISDALPDFSKVALRPISNTEGTVVLTAKGNLTFTEEFVKSLTVLWSVAYLGNNNKAIMVKPNTATVTLIVNGNTVTQTVPIGGDSVFELPDTWEGIAEDKYISEWTWNGNSYPSGKAVPIDGNRTFTAVIGNKFTVTLKYADDDIETHYVKPNERFYLPVDSHNEQYKIIGWNVGDTMYLPAAGFDVKGNTEVVADLMKLFKVVINDKDIESVSWQEYSYSFVLEEPEAPEGKKFAYWNVNGVRYEAGQTISITSDTVIKAVFNGVLSGGIIALIVIIIFLALNGAVATAVLVLRRKKQLAAAGATTGGATTAGGSTKSTTKSKSTGTLEKSAAKTTATKSTAATATAKPAAKPATTATAKPAAKPTTTTAAKPTAKPATTATAKPAAKPTTTATAKPAAKSTTTATAKPAAKPATTATAKPAAKPTTTATTKPATKPTTTATTKPAAKSTTTTAAKPAAKPATKSTTSTKTTAKTTPKTTPKK